MLVNYSQIMRFSKLITKYKVKPISAEKNNPETIVVSSRMKFMRIFVERQAI